MLYLVVQLVRHMIMVKVVGSKFKLHQNRCNVFSRNRGFPLLKEMLPSEFSFMLGV